MLLLMARGGAYWVIALFTLLYGLGSGETAVARDHPVRLRIQDRPPRAARWRLLATRDPKGVATFKTNAGKAEQQISELEKSGLPQDLAGLLLPVKAGVAKYSQAFETASSSLL